MSGRGTQTKCGQCRRLVRPNQISFGTTCMECARANDQKLRSDKSDGRTEKEIWEDFRENGFQ